MLSASRVIVVPTAEELARAGADLVFEVISSIPTACILAATGATPMDLYAELARRRPDATRVRVAALDEYVGVPQSDPRSLTAWLHRSFMGPLGIEETALVGFDPASSDPSAECASYDAAVAAAGGIDLAILGLGPNGHLGFNEPPSDATAPTRVVDLSPESLLSNAGYWDGAAVPARAYTAGMSVLMAARRVLLVVSGAHKHRILRRVLDGPVTDEVPASFLQQHPDATVLVDAAAYLG